MRGSTQTSFVLLTILASLLLSADARPSRKDVYKKKDPQKLQKIEGDLDWESKWWTPPEKKESKDSWKVFKTEKPTVMKRWWEEDWDEDEWWSPKGSSFSSSNSVSSDKKPYVETKKGESKEDLVNKPEKDVIPPLEKQDKKDVTESKPDQKTLSSKPNALPEPVESMSLQDKQGSVQKSDSKAERLDYIKKNDINQNDKEGYNKKKEGFKKVEVPVYNKKVEAQPFIKKEDPPVYLKDTIPAVESPREQVNPILKKDTMISPFEDPKPGPYAGPKDEKPSKGSWEYHQLSGFGKYIEHGKAQEAEKNEKYTNYDKQEDEMSEEDKAKLMKEVEAKIEEEENNRVIKVPQEDRKKVLDQFYGFGLETAPSAKPSAPAQKEEAKKLAAPEPLKEDVKDIPAPSKEDYNKGVIYDVIPGHPEETHSVKKDLSNSEYMKDFVSTKANLQTSPNPPPPGIAEEVAGDSKTTPLVPSKMTAKTDKAQTYAKSHPLKYCKVDEECRKGRMCRDGMCVCLPDDGCAGHHKPVCGSDGVEYPSHCELHRTACVKHVHIKVDHVGNCFTTHEKVQAMQKIQRDDYKEHVLSKAHALRDDSDTDDEDDENEDEEDEDGYDSSDYDEDYDYEDEEDQDKDEWEKSRSDKMTVDSKMIYDESKDLKKESKKKLDQDDNKVDQAPWDHVKEEKGDDFYVKGKGDKKDTKGDYGFQSDGGYKECTKEELAKFKHQLLAFHCKRFDEPNCKLEVKEEREYLTNLMFSYLDINTDYQLSYDELKTRQKTEKFDDLNSVCALTDLIWYDDILNADARLSLDEFEQAFNHLDVKNDKKKEESESLTSSSPTVHIIPTLATVGNGLELKCGLAAKGTDVVWRRHGVSIRDLAMIELLVLDDGSLFFSKMGVHHMGNYSCEDAAEPSVLQVHSLKVQMPPIVRVSPHSQIEPSMTDVKVRCHAEGVPKPSIAWQMNNKPLTAEPHHYALEGNNEQLMVYKADYQKDTGAYKCVAKNQAGTSEDVSSLFVIGDKERTVGMGFTSINSGKFAVFHKDGYTAYNPDDCLKHHSVHGDFGYFKFIPDNLDGPLRLCNDGQDCSWGSVVNVKNSFLYVSQPAMNRVVVIETSKNWIPVQVISTDKVPMQLHYVAHLDQVWVLCWNGEGDESTKTIVVVRDASKYVQHRAVHTQPVGNHFDQIQALFIAPDNDLRHSFDYGYVTHNGQQGLTKLDLDNMRYFKAVDLSAYDCVPRSLAFVPIGGHIVVECVSPVNHQTLQLVMDYITDAVVSTAVLSGCPYVSPDSRHVVTVDDLTGKVSVAGVSNEGMLEAAYEVTVSASISDVAFFPTSGHGYLLILTSADDDDIITINLSTGKVDKMKGTNRAATSSDWHPSPVKREITSGDVFTDFLLAPSKSSISVIDVKFRQVKCEFTAAPRSDAAIFVGNQ